MSLHQNLLLLNAPERYLTEQSLNHPVFLPLRQLERPGPPSPNPSRSAKRKTHHHGENTVPTRSACRNLERSLRTFTSIIRLICIPF